MDTTIDSRGMRRPLSRDRPHGARHDLHVQSHLGEARQQHVELAEADERLAADERDVHGAVLPDEFDDTVDERLALEIAHFAEGDAAAQVLGPVGVTPRAPQGTLTRDLDRERGRVASKNSTPGLHNPVHNTSCAPRRSVQE